MHLLLSALEEEFMNLRNDPADNTGKMYHRQFLQDSNSMKVIQEEFKKYLFVYTLGFDGTKIPGG